MPGKLSRLAQFLTIHTNMPRCFAAAQSICAQYKQMVLLMTNHLNPLPPVRE